MTDKICLFHKGLEVEIANTKQKVLEIKTEEVKQTDTIQKIYENLARKPSTTTLLVGIGIIASLIMGIVTLVYYAHKSGDEKQQVQIQRNADEIQKTNKRLDAQFSGVINGLAATQTMIKERLPEKKKEPAKK